MAPVHPRLRGELISACPEDYELRGSSPLTRGTQILIVLVMALARFIPAYAGNSWTTCLWTLSFSVHPRLRGELHVERKASLNGAGSSPLTRGTHLKTV